MEDSLQWMTTFNGRRPSMEGDLQWKTAFDGKQPSMEDNIWWKTTFDGIWPLMLDKICWKIAFHWRTTTSKIQMNLNNDDDLKNKEDLYVAGRHTALDMDIFHFSAIFTYHFYMVFFPCNLSHCIFHITFVILLCKKIFV